MFRTPIGRLRIVSLVEGISYLLLVFIGMPLKYGMEMPMPNKILGMGHGILTIVFCFTLLSLWSEKKIPISLAIQTFIASLIPFGAFYIERKLKKIPQS
jgi:integral membrane protein